MLFRGLMFDSARCLENRAYYQRAIAFAAERGIDTVLWHFTDDQGCTLRFDALPGIASPNAYSKQEMRDLIAFARQHGITVIPELASLGHSRYITRLPAYRHLDEIEHVFTGMSPVEPLTRQILTELMDEVAEVFDSPWIHVGLDEANIGHHPATKAALEHRTRGDLMADHINFMHDLVRRHNRTMMMWGDGLLHDRTIAPRLSRDILICDWQYGEAVDGSTTQYFLDEGFDVVLCPALISFGQTLFPGDQLAVSNLRTILAQRGRRGAGKVVGAIETIWQPERYMHDALWIGIDLAAAMLREGPEISIEETIARFVGSFYGLDAPVGWVDACREMFRLAPLRAEWLALNKLQFDKLPPAAEVKGRCEAWQGIVAAIASAEPKVARQADAYRVFKLTAEIMAHLYRRADLLQNGPADPETLQALVDQEEPIVEAVDRVWDAERFADDPKKYTPAREVMRDNHLVVLLHSGLAQLRALLAKAQAVAREPVTAV